MRGCELGIVHYFRYTRIDANLFCGPFTRIIYYMLNNESIVNDTGYLCSIGGNRFRKVKYVTSVCAMIMSQPSSRSTLHSRDRGHTFAKPVPIF